MFIDDMLIHIAALLLLFLPRFVLTADPGQLITELPGQPYVEFKQYSGEIVVNATEHRALFYWFFEADHVNGSSLPLAIWFNGGPGCSSIGNGALSELGPFRTHESGTGLLVNRFSWTRAANIIFLESPAGVGFSYASNSSTFSDEQSAMDALSFILEWLNKFPEYSKNDFYLLGESYAGHYIPTLAAKIVHYNKASPTPINFKGFAIGNPWTDAYYDNRGDTEFLYSHAIISYSSYQKLINNCDFSKDLPVDEGDNNTVCQAALNQMENDIAEIDYYNVYALSCNTNSSNSSSTIRLFGKEMLTAAYNPCLDSVTPYLNMEQTQQALHVPNRPVKWSSCSSRVVRAYPGKDVITSMVPVYKELLKQGLRILIYSGDVDAVVSTIGTRNWIQQLNLTVEIPWYAWDFKNQVGGWTEMYSSRFSYVTVRGAGHMVPANKPEQSLMMFKHFLSAKPLPKF